MGKRTTITGRMLLLLLELSLVTLGSALDRQRELGQYGHQSWQTDNGLPQNTVRAVLQTRDGYLWLATDGGLVRFDGVQFVVYDKQSAPRLPGNGVNSLFEDHTGALWISTSDGLTRRRGGGFTTFTTADGLPANTVWSVYESREGKLLALTSQGLAFLRGERFEPIPALPAGFASSSSIVESPDGSLWIGTGAGVIQLKDGQVHQPPNLAHVETQALAAGADGRIWIGTRAGLEIAGGSAVTKLTHQQGLPSDEVTALLAGPVGRVWVGTAAGLAMVEAGHVTSYGVKDGLPGERIQALYADREGAVWVSTNRGMARFLNGRFETFGVREGLSGELVLSIFEDREGSLWMGTESGGLTVLHDQKFTTLTAADGLSENLVRSVFQDRKGVVWIGTNGGGLDRLNVSKNAVPIAAPDEAPRFTNFSTVSGLSSNIVLALADDAEGALWVGTPDGLNRLVDGHVTTYTSADGLADDFVRSLYTSADGALWIGTRRGLSRFEDGRFTSYTRMDGLGSDLVGALLEERRGELKADPVADAAPSAGLWIGTLGGLSHLRNGRFTTLTTRDGLSSNIVTALHHDTAGSLWIGTRGGGLNRLHDGVVTPFSPAATGLPENVYAILEDGADDGLGNLWLSSDKGVYRVGIQELDAFASGTTHHLMPSVYGRADGMAISEASSGGHPSAWRLRDGTLEFATLKGVAMIDPRHASENAEPPPLAIEQVSFDDRVLEDAGSEGAGREQSGTLVLPPGQGRLAIEYTAMSFVAPQKVRFRYRLDGFDRDWVDAGTRRTAFYTNIPPGRYTFRVTACNNDGVWNDAGAALELRLRPHFYQTWIFDLALLVLTAVLAYGIYRRRVQRVESQFGAVLAERGRIAREIHDTLAQSLVAISVQLEIVSRLLASSTASARTHLDQARALTRDSLTEARSSIWDLRSGGSTGLQSKGAGSKGMGLSGPGSNGSAGNTPAAEDLATRMSAMANRVTASTSIKIQSKVGGAYHPLPEKLEAELLRIAQEAVTNAVRHADPQHIKISLHFDTNRLTMVIEDDGCGFSGQPHPRSEGPEGHFGLTGMRERAAQIGGTLLIESSRGIGTLVRVEVPIE